MSKSAEAFRTISEVAEELDLHKHVLRFWEVKFPQIKPMKRGGGRRYYRPSDLELLRGIRYLLHSEGYTIKGVQRIIREKGIDAVKRVTPEGGAPGAAEKSDTAPTRAGLAEKATAAESAVAAGTKAGRAAERASSRAVDAANEVAARSRAPGERGREPEPAQASRKLSMSQRQVIVAALAELRACRDVLTGGPASTSTKAQRLSG